MWVKWKCRRIAAYLWEYSNGDLPLSEMERVRVHLMECPSCRTDFEAARRTAPLVASLRDAAGATSETNFQDLIARLETRQRQSASLKQRAANSSYFAIGGVALAACVLIAVRANKPLSVPENASISADRSTLTEEAKVLAKRPEPIRRKPLAVAVAPAHDEIRAAQVKKTRSVVSLHLASVRLTLVSHRRRMLASSGSTHGQRLNAAVYHRPHAAAAGHNLARNDAAMGMGLGRSGEQQSGTAQPQPVMMSLIGAGEERGLSRAFVIDRIPTTTLTGQAGTVAAEAQNPEAGKAL